MAKIAVHLAEGFEEIEAISIIDVLRRAAFDVVSVSVTGERRVVGSHEIPVFADELFENINYSEVDMIVLPGGMPGAKNLNSHKGLKNKILDFNKKGKFLGAICAAPLVFGELGILNGKIATCYPGFESYLEGAKLTDSAIQADENIITGRGAGVAIHFALKIVELLENKTTANELAEKMVVPQT